MGHLLPLEKELQIMRQTPISMQYDGKEPLNVWQTRAREKLSELLGMEYFLPCDPCFAEESRTEYEDYTEIRFSFQSEENLFVPCVLWVPRVRRKNATAICLQGHGRGMHVTLGIYKYPEEEAKKDGERDFAVQCMREGICALAMDQRNFGERGGDPKPTCYIPSMDALLLGRTTIGGRVRDIQCAIDVLQSAYAEYCADGIYCMGNSGGGTATIYAAALEERISAAIPSCAFCTFADSIGSMHHCACNFVPNIRRYFDMAELAGMIAPRPLVIVSGKEDDIFPLSGAVAEFARVRDIYYAASEKPQNCVHVHGEGGHRFYAKPAWAALHHLLP